MIPDSYAESRSVNMARADVSPTLVSSLPSIEFEPSVDHHTGSRRVAAKAPLEALLIQQWHNVGYDVSSVSEFSYCRPRQTIPLR